MIPGLQTQSIAILQSVINGVWQGALLVGCLTLLFRFVKANATTRYAVWLSALVLILLLPFGPIFKSANVLPKTSATLTAMPAQPDFSSHSLKIPLPAWFSLLLCGSLIAVSGIRFTGLMRSWISLLQLKRASNPADPEIENRLQRILVGRAPQREAHVRISSEIDVPLTTGFTNPFILIPEKLIGRLPEADLDQILIHEVAHLARRDDWSRLFQKSVEALFFFSPAVLWVSRQLDLEREIACDDLVIEETSSPQLYASCLTRLVEFAGWSCMRLPVPVITANQLYRRIEMLLNRKRNRSLFVLKGGFAFALILLCVLFVTVIKASPLVAVCPSGEAALHSAEQKLQSAENQIWKAADEKLQAQSERQRYEAERSLSLARDQMKKARDEMQAARDQLRAAKDLQWHGKIEVPEGTVVLEKKLSRTIAIRIPEIHVEVPDVKVITPRVSPNAIEIEIPARKIRVELPEFSYSMAPVAPPAPVAHAAPPAPPARVAQPSPAAPVASPAPKAPPAPVAQPAPAAPVASPAPREYAAPAPQPEPTPQPAPTEPAYETDSN